MLAGTDYVYPRTTNQILEAYLKAKGVAPEDIMINYTPFGHADWQTIVSDIATFGSAGKKTAVVSTINGDANVPFYKELGNQGISAEDIPVVAFSVGEEELAGLDTEPLVGHLAAWNYFMSVDTDENAEFIETWHDFIGNEDRVTNDPMEAHYIGFNMWVKAVEAAGTTDTDAVHRGDDRRRGAEPDRRPQRHDAQPPHHQAGAGGRDPGRRPVRGRLGDDRPGRRRRMVRPSAGIGGSDRRLALADVLRQLQRRHRPVRRRHQLILKRQAVQATCPARPYLGERMRLLSPILIWLALAFAPALAAAQTFEELVARLPDGSYNQRAEVVAAIAATGDERAAAVLEALGEGDLHLRESDGRIAAGDRAAWRAAGHRRADRRGGRLGGARARPRRSG